MTIAEQECIYELLGIELYTSMLSPFRLESRPSFSTIIKDDKVIWKDFGSGEGGDVYTFTMHTFGINFYDAKAKIADLLSGAEVKVKVKERENQVTKAKKEPLSVVHYGSHRKFELDFWSARDIEEATLLNEDIYPLKLLRNDKSFLATSSINNPKFVYYLNNERTAWKVYSPYDKEHKWVSKNINLVPFESAPEGLYKDLIIFSSKKDRLVFKTMNLPYDTTSLLAEGNYYGMLDELGSSLSAYENIYSFLDFDAAGMAAAAKIEQLSNKRIKPINFNINIQNYLSSSYVKDIDEIRIKLGRRELIRLIDHALKNTIDG